jgi:hypothetical protein
VSAEAEVAEAVGAEAAVAGAEVEVEALECRLTAARWFAEFERRCLDHRS